MFTQQTESGENISASRTADLYFIMLALLMLFALSACGSQHEQQVVVEPVVTKRINLGLYVGYFDVDVLVGKNVRHMYGLYTSKVTGGIYLYAPPRAVFIQDFCTLIQQYQGDSPSTPDGTVICGTDLINTDQAYVPGPI